MEHIINSEVGGIDFDKYLKYVNSIKSKLPAHIYAFASDSGHFDFESHTSLHDAWIETWSVRETAAGEGNEIRGLEIDLSLLGPFHDRRIHLRYTGVKSYKFDVPSKNNKFGDKGHGDLYTHEIRLSHDGLLIHELLFERGATFLIECSDIRHSVAIIKA
jgi:hypothetical protein